MLQFSLDPQAEARILCLGAHSDDIEIGCGATILRLIEQYPRLHIRWVVFSSNPRRRSEAQHSAELFLQGAARTENSVLEFRDGFFPYIGGEIKEHFEQIKREFTPDMVFTHYRNDRHQDHRQISDLAWNTFRSHFILEYEIPKYDGDLGVPNLFLPISPEIARRKVGYLMESFVSQHDKKWFTEDTFFSMMRLRGIEASEQTQYAEAFYARKVVI
jgi:LmbE family N-acetylglucosaminyl deacetylase